MLRTSLGIAALASASAYLAWPDAPRPAWSADFFAHVPLAVAIAASACAIFGSALGAAARRFFVVAIVLFVWAIGVGIAGTLHDRATLALADAASARGGRVAWLAGAGDARLFAHLRPNVFVPDASFERIVRERDPDYAARALRYLGVTAIVMPAGATPRIVFTGAKRAALRASTTIVRVTAEPADRLARMLPALDRAVLTDDPRPWAAAEIVDPARRLERVLGEVIGDPMRFPDALHDGDGFRFATSADAVLVLGTRSQSVARIVPQAHVLRADDRAATPRWTVVAFDRPIRSVRFSTDDAPLRVIPIEAARYFGADAALADDMKRAAQAHGIPLDAHPIARFPERLEKGTVIATDRPYDPAFVARCGSATLEPTRVDGWAQGYFARARLRDCREARRDAPASAYFTSVAFLALFGLTQGGLLARRIARTRSRTHPAARTQRAERPRAVVHVSSRVTLGVAIVAGTLGIAATGAVVRAFAVDVPLYDEWLWIPIVAHAHAGTLAFSELWAAQNVHRSIVPTVLALGIVRAVGWHVWSEAAASIVFASASFGIVASLFARTRRSTIVALAACALLVYSFAQMENWLWGFQVAWFLTNACAFGAFAALARSTRLGFGIALACAIGATYALILGTLIWPIGGAILLAQKRVRAFAIWAAIALASGTLFLIDYHPPGGQLGATHLALDGSGLAFLVGYLGAPLALGAPTVVAQLLGTLGLLAFLASAIRTTARRFASAPDSLAFLGIGAFACGGAILEAIGRASYGADAALTSRYTTIGIDLWIALVGLAASACVRERPRARLALVAIASLVGIASLGTTVSGLQSALALNGVAAAARAELLAGGRIADPSRFTIRPTRFDDDLRLLRTERLMPFDR